MKITFYETHYYNGGEFGFNEEDGEDYGRDFVLREYENGETDKYPEILTKLGFTVDTQEGFFACYEADGFTNPIQMLKDAGFEYVADGEFDPIPEPKD